MQVSKVLSIDASPLPCTKAARNNHLAVFFFSKSQLTVQQPRRAVIDRQSKAGERQGERGSILVEKVACSPLP